MLGKIRVDDSCHNRLSTLRTVAVVSNDDDIRFRHHVHAELLGELDDRPIAVRKRVERSDVPKPLSPTTRALACRIILFGVLPFNTVTTRVGRTGRGRQDGCLDGRGRGTKNQRRSQRIHDRFQQPAIVQQFCNRAKFRSRAMPWR